MRPYQKHPASGFSLVELSIVLVILALLVGGIMVGTSLIRSARINSIIADKTQYENAIQNFKQQYKALPGDMANATDIWGYAPGGSNYTNCAALTTASTTKATCNGNGNDSIYDDVSARAHEQYRMWQHLANAGLISGNYTGVNQCGGTQYTLCNVPGVNSPLSRIDGATFHMVDVGRAADADLWFDFMWTGTAQINKHILFFGATTPGATGTAPFQPVLSPGEAWSMDQKFDDARPGLGKIRVFSSDAGNPFSAPLLCASTNVSSTAEYNLNRSDIQCTPYFYMNF